MSLSGVKLIKYAFDAEFPRVRSLRIVSVEPVFIFMKLPHHWADVVFQVKLSKVALPSIFRKKCP